MPLLFDCRLNLNCNKILLATVARSLQFVSPLTAFLFFAISAKLPKSPYISLNVC